MNNLPESLAALAFFGGLFLCPLIWMLLGHQRKMAELLNSRGSDEALHRIAVLEERVRELSALQHEMVVRQDDVRLRVEG